MFLIVIMLNDYTFPVHIDNMPHMLFIIHHDVGALSPLDMRYRQTVKTGTIFCVERCEVL